MSPRGRLGSRLALVGIVALLVAGMALVFVRADVDGPLTAVRVIPTTRAPVTMESTPVPTEQTTPAPVPVGTGQTGEGIPVAEEVATDTDPYAATPFVNVEPSPPVVKILTSDTEEQAVRDWLSQMEGVLHVAGLTVTTTTLGGVSARIAEVDAEEYRPFTPEATANHQPLWERILAGDVAVTHEFGTVHEVPLGSRLATGLDIVTGDSLSFRVGAYATNGTPPVADAIVQTGSLATGTALDRSTPPVRELLVSLEPLASPEATVDALVQAGFAAEEIADPRLPRSDTVVPTEGMNPDNVWDYLAQCESSGDWQINTGNGYYGGIQFLPESWQAVGGQGLPHENTREEQIYRGTLLWQIQGWNAWPQCARKLGLIVDPPPQPTPTPRPTGTVQTEPPE